MAKQWMSTQTDLFEKPPLRGKAVAPAQRAKALEQLQTLVMEAMVALESWPEAGDTEIKPEYLVRDAIVYVRQSTAFQVVQNLESQRRQYGLAQRARQLG
jgi:hypothetical protein